MVKIVVTSDFGFTKDQARYLNTMGKVKFYTDAPRTKEAWLKRVEGADIICSESFGLIDNLYNLKNVFVTYPFVSLGKIDLEKLKKNNVVLANSPSCNNDAVAEWVIYMLLNLFRQFPKFINNTDLPKGQMLPVTQSLKFKNVTILGRGNIGLHLGHLCSAFGMNLKFFVRGDDLFQTTKKADVIINCLSLNDDSINLLNRDFFFSLKKCPYFVTFTKKEIYDFDAVVEALDTGVLSGVAVDCGGEEIGDVTNEFYKRALAHDKIIVTPHIAWCADISMHNGNKIVIDNVKAWINKAPINVLK
ncbi:MAG: hydroxyacid dehydrogenase [DPANN group archaeon]|nr:hydroxyacid dehydrogenase [DPANN group archaeon]